MTTGQMLENLKNVRERIAQAARQSGRDPSEIKLVGAVKTMPSELIAAAMPQLYAAGENRVPEFEANCRSNAYCGGRVHFIGHLQTNKVKKVAGRVELIHSVDSLRLAQCISDHMTRQGGVQKILLEVNIGRERSKSGIMPEQAHELAGECGRLPGIAVEGLMAIPPKCRSEEQASVYFCEMNKLFIDIAEKKYDNVSMCILSMGMSGDYYRAILDGANMVRVGSAIFGPRNTAATE